MPVSLTQPEQVLTCPTQLRCGLPLSGDSHLRMPYRRLPRRHRQAAVAETATTPPPTFQPISPHPPPPKLAAPSDIPAIRKYLLQIGWQRPWVDGISDRLFKREFTLTVDQAKAVVEFLHTLHIQPDNICNMMTIAPRALSLDVGSTLKPIIEYIQAQGVSGDGLARLLSAHPKLLLYTPTEDRQSLALDKARAGVSVSSQNGSSVGHVSYWRENTTFAKSPVAPWRPKPQ